MSEQTGMLRRLSVAQGAYQEGLYLGRHSGAVTVATLRGHFGQLSLGPSGGSGKLRCGLILLLPE